MSLKTRKGPKRTLRAHICYTKAAQQVLIGLSRLRRESRYSPAWEQRHFPIRRFYQALRRGSVNAERLIVTNASVSSRAIKGVRTGYVASLLQKGSDVVAVKDGAGTMATDRHCHALADTGTDHVSCC